MDGHASPAASAATPQQFALPTVETLWRIVQEQQARIQTLESLTPPLPEASSRVNLGRSAVVPRRRRKTRVTSGSGLPAVDAFHDLAPITADYATLPITEGFNWSECTERVKPGEWYMVVFRSVRREAADDLTLEMHDYGAYIEAERRAEGLVYYFRGTPNERRECLSFCIWNSRDEAVRAAQLPLHRLAMSMVDEKYESYTLERYAVSKARGSHRVEVTPISPPASTHEHHTAK